MNLSSNDKDKNNTTETNYKRTGWIGKLPHTTISFFIISEYLESTELKKGLFELHKLFGILWNFAESTYFSIFVLQIAYLVKLFWVPADEVQKEFSKLGYHRIDNVHSANNEYHLNWELCPESCFGILKYTYGTNWFKLEKKFLFLFGLGNQLTTVQKKIEIIWVNGQPNEYWNISF